MPDLDYTDQLGATLEPTRAVVYKTIAGRELHLNLFDPPGLADGDRRPCFLTIHGGGWTGLSPRRQYPSAAHFASRGMVGIAVEYRLVPANRETTVVDCVKDARSAVRYVRAHAAELGVDPRRIVVQGGSAGGHLAAGTALFDGVDEASDDLAVSCAPNALVLFFPVIDTSDRGYGKGLLQKQWRELSPLHRVKAGVAPTILFHGTGDVVTPFEGARNFHQAMLAAGNRCELVPTEGAGHGYLMFDREPFEQAIAQTEVFLASLSLLP